MTSAPSGLSGGPTEAPVTATFAGVSPPVEPLLSGPALLPVALFKGGGRPSTAVVEAVLAVVRRHLSMAVSFVAQFHDGDRVIRYVDGDGVVPLRGGDRDPVEDSLCARVVDGRLPAAVTDASVYPASSDLPITRTLGVRGHIGVPIRLPDGTVFGTFCCLDPAPAPHLGATEVATMRVVADLLGSYLAGEHGRAAADRQTIERIDRVLAAGGPACLYQPIVALDTGTAVGWEALARFPGTPVLPPDRWFADAARVGRDIELEVAAVARAAGALPDLPPGAFLTVNVSPTTARTRRFADLLTGLPADRLVVELTEHADVEDYPALRAALEAFRAAGGRLAVDDTGAGYAGLRHLVDLRPDIVKLDLDLTRGIDTDPARQALALALNFFTGRMDAILVAEGIETVAERDMLIGLGVTHGQGYLLGRPAPFPHPSSATIA